MTHLPASLVTLSVLVAAAAAGTAAATPPAVLASEHGDAEHARLFAGGIL